VCDGPIITPGVNGEVIVLPEGWFYYRPTGRPKPHSGIIKTGGVSESRIIRVAKLAGMKHDQIASEQMNMKGKKERSNCQTRKKTKTQKVKTRPQGFTFVPPVLSQTFALAPAPHISWKADGPG